MQPVSEFIVQNQAGKCSNQWKMLFLLIAVLLDMSDCPSPAPACPHSERQTAPNREHMVGHTVIQLTMGELGRSLRKTGDNKTQSLYHQ